MRGVTVRLPARAVNNGGGTCGSPAAQPLNPRQLCKCCQCSAAITDQLCNDINGVVRKTFANLLSMGRRPVDAARSALVVLRIHQPGLCSCNIERVRDWLLQSHRG